MILWQHRHAARSFVGVRRTSRSTGLGSTSCRRPNVGRVVADSLTAQCSLAARVARQLRLGRKKEVEEFSERCAMRPTTIETRWLTVALLDWPLGRLEDVGETPRRLAGPIRSRYLA
jgi:hypothetical protein